MTISGLPSHLRLGLGAEKGRGHNSRSPGLTLGQAGGAATVSVDLKAPRRRGGRGTGGRAEERWWTGGGVAREREGVARERGGVAVGRPRSRASPGGLWGYGRAEGVARELGGRAYGVRGVVVLLRPCERGFGVGCLRLRGGAVEG